MLQSQNNALARSSLLRNGTEFTRTKGSSAPTVAAPYIPDGQRSSGSRSSARGPSPFAAGCSSTSVPGPIAPASKGTCDARSRKATFQYRAGRARCERCQAGWRRIDTATACENEPVVSQIRVHIGHTPRRSAPFSPTCKSERCRAV